MDIAENKMRGTN